MNTILRSISIVGTIAVGACAGRKLALPPVDLADAGQDADRGGMSLAMSKNHETGSANVGPMDMKSDALRIGDAAVQGFTLDGATNTAVTPAQPFALPEVAADVAAACMTYAGDFCKKEHACVPKTFVLNYHDEKDCQRQLELRCRLNLGLNGVGDTPARRLQCGATFVSMTCEDLFATSPEACKQVPGTLGLDAACNHVAFQCAPGLYCQIPFGSTCGRCRAVIPDGQPCGGGGIFFNPCGTGSACRFEPSPVAQTCVVTTKPGGVCGGNSGAVCDSGTECINNLCSSNKHKDVGASCAGDGECSPRTGYCNRVTKRCEAVRIGGVGAACGLVNDGTSAIVYCVVGTSCVAGIGTVARTCVPDLPLGAICDVRNGSRCARPAACNGGSCRVLFWPACP